MESKLFYQSRCYLIMITFNRTSMESKRSKLLFVIPIRTTFNRTSMESKRGYILEGFTTGASLLIEPVWNRNCSVGERRVTATFYLLIEPVWNRNAYTIPEDRISPLPFNRTSMESKPISAITVLSSVVTFNRTSMESKHFQDFPSDFQSFPFNRTSMESKRAPRLLLSRHSRWLLIEPVWNRNVNSAGS